MAFSAATPSNDELLTNFPALCRANWDGIVLGTDANLLITNAKCAAAMGLVDTKLAQITTAAKVHGTAITGLASLPSGAGVVPDANSNGKMKADSSDTTPQYLDSLLDTGVFQISAGDLLQLKDGGVEMEKLESGSAAPGNSKYYGTNVSGTKGFFSLYNLESGMIVLWSGSIATIPTGYVLCNGLNSTPDLTDKFVIHADADSGGTNDVDDTGGSKIISTANLPAHTHGAIAAHTHDVRIGYNSVAAGYKGYNQSYSTLSGYFSNASEAGGGHTHDSVGSGTDYLPKYYALAYIMKT